MKKKLINLTPHTLNIKLNNGDFAIIEPSGEIARVSTENVLTREIGTGFSGEIPCFIQTTGEVTGLPEKDFHTILIVSAMVRLALPERRDLASPGDLIRNDAGQPIGCNGLVVNKMIPPPKKKVVNKRIAP